MLKERVAEEVDLALQGTEHRGRPRPVGISWPIPSLGYNGGDLPAGEVYVGLERGVAPDDLVDFGIDGYVESSLWVMDSDLPGPLPSCMSVCVHMMAYVNLLQTS